MGPREVTWHQWRSSWGGRVPPDSFYKNIFADLPGEERQGKERRENLEEKKENCKREGGRFKMGMEKYEMSRKLFFFGFVFVLFCLFCFVFTLWNHWNLFGVYQNGDFYREKSISRQEKAFHTGKNQEKWLCPSPLPKNIPLTPLLGTSCWTPYQKKKKKASFFRGFLSPVHGVDIFFRIKVALLFYMNRPLGVHFVKFLHNLHQLRAKIGSLYGTSRPPIKIGLVQIRGWWMLVATLCESEPPPPSRRA